jgi:negative regulator of flagellin synthesis FlgM
MNISDKNATLPINIYIQQVQKNPADTKCEPDAAKVTPRRVEDNVELCQSGRDVRYAKEMLESVPDIRQEKVARLKSRIENGTYRIDSQKVAQKMMEESILNDLLSE